MPATQTPYRFLDSQLITHLYLEDIPTGLLAFARRGRFDEFFAFALLLAGLYFVARLLDRYEWGNPKVPQWRFTGRDEAGTPPEPRVPRDREQDETPFDILQIAPTEDLDKINAAYIRLAKKTHPDLNPDDAQATKKFQRVQLAFSKVGDEMALRLYLIDHPLLGEAETIRSTADREVVDLDLFKQDWAAYRAIWLHKQAAAERDMKYLQGPPRARVEFLRRFAGGLVGRFWPPPAETMLVDKVCFLAQDELQLPRLPYLQIFGKLLRVDTQEDIHEVVTFLLSCNNVYFLDQFHTSNAVSFRDIGRRPGYNAALSPKGSYAEFVTNLAKLGLYKGPDVRKVR